MLNHDIYHTVLMFMKVEETVELKLCWVEAVIDPAIMSMYITVSITRGGESISPWSKIEVEHN